MGITPNEVADAECDKMTDAAHLSDVDLAPSSRHLVRMQGVKGGIGRFTFEFMEARVLQWQMKCIVHSLHGTARTWRMMANVRKMKLLEESKIDVLEDCRVNSIGLLADSQVDVEAAQVCVPIENKRERTPRKGGWQWYCITHAPCPGCQIPIRAGSTTVAGLYGRQTKAQSRWHTITTCPGRNGENVEPRRAAAGWLMKHLDDFNTRHADYALTALQGDGERLDGTQKRAALHFLLGLPDTPREDMETSRALAAGYCKGFISKIVGIVKNGTAASLAATKGKYMEGPCRGLMQRGQWMSRRGLRTIWEHARLVTQSFRAVRVESAMNKVDADSIAEAIHKWTEREKLQSAIRRWQLTAPQMMHARPPPQPWGQAGRVLVWLRHDEPGTRRAAELASEKIASLVRVRQARKTAAELRARKKIDTKAQRIADEAERARQNTRRMVERGKRVGVGLMQSLFKKADAAARVQATRGVLRKIAKVRNERAAKQRAFKNMLTNLVSEGDREMRATATATVVRRMRRRHYLRTRASAARKAFSGALRRLVAQGDRSIAAVNKKKRKQATEAALTRVKRAHKEAVEARSKKRAREEATNARARKRKWGCETWEGTGDEDGVSTRSRRLRAAGS